MAAAAPPCVGAADKDAVVPLDGHVYNIKEPLMSGRLWEGARYTAEHLRLFDTCRYTAHPALKSLTRINIGREK